MDNQGDQCTPCRRPYAMGGDREGSSAPLYDARFEHDACGIGFLADLSGRPTHRILSTEVGTATSWINQHGVTGLVAPARSPEGLAQAIVALQSDAAQRRRMGLAARQRIEAHFSEQKMIAGVNAVYERILAEPPHSASRV